MDPIPTLPPGESPPTIAEMSERLAQALPAADRAEGQRLLRDEILPRELAGLADHPKPRRLAELIYQRIADALTECPPEERLARLHELAARAEIRAHGQRALSLAVARYLAEHPAAQAQAESWRNPTVEQWQAKPAEAIAQEAEQQLRALEEWKARAEADFPALWQQYRPTYSEAKLTLQAARSGSFASATGSLHDFLREMGDPTQTPDLH